MNTLDHAIRSIQPLDEPSMQSARARLASLTMPPGALGRLCELAVRLSGIRAAMPPPAAKRRIVTMAGDHGVVAEGVSAYSQEVTQQMVANIVRGGAGVNVLARMNGAEVAVADFGMKHRDETLIASGALLDANVGKGTANMATGPAMTRGQALRCVENGIAIAFEAADVVDVFGTGEMGIGNTTPATAIAAAVTGLPVAALAGSGTGLTGEGLARKIGVIEQALKLNRPDPADALDVLAKVGGFEIGGIAGLIIGAAARRRPVLVDGFISTSGAIIARLLCPAALDYAILAHASAEPGHAAMCEWLGREPLLDLGMRLGEGTGAAMAMNVLEAAARILTEMATFASAGVDGERLDSR